MLSWQSALRGELSAEIITLSMVALGALVGCSESSPASSAAHANGNGGSTVGVGGSSATTNTTKSSAGGSSASSSSIPNTGGNSSSRESSGSAVGGSSTSARSSGTGGGSSSKPKPVINGKLIEGDDCTIKTATLWPKDVYVANCTLDVESELTIEPGTIVKFGSGNYLNVHPDGLLTAVGTEALPIVFTSLQDDEHGGDTGGDGATSAAKNDWGCQGSCGDLNIEGAGSVLKHVQDLYGSNGVYVRAELVRVENSVFAHHGGYGLVLDKDYSVGSTALTGNAFYDNGGYPLHLGAVVFLDGSNIFHDPANPEITNTKQCVELGADVDQLTIIGVTELGFLLGGHKVSGELLLPPGVIFKAQNSKITLEASGSFANGPNMIFTSYKDDALGGDCTGDGDTAPADGDWEGVWIDDGTNSGYAEPNDDIRYAANSGNIALH